jgi:dienelactone hydrolase
VAVITRMHDTWRLLGRVLVVLAAVSGGALAVAADETPALEPSLGEFVSRVPSTGFTEPELEVTIFKPPGDGRFPVVMLNHGRAPGNPRLQPRWRPLLAAREFVQRGYAVVVPMRQGFANSGGAEIVGGCNVASNGHAQARSVRRTADWLATQDWADTTRVVVMGQSHGGLTTLAYGTDARAGTRLLVNFAGGLRQDQCPNWEDALVSAIGGYGGRTNLPSLWFYGDNDSFFSPAIFRAAFERYVAAGGDAQLVAFGTFGRDAHAMFASRAGLPIWVPRVTAALAAVGLPVAKLRLISPPGDLPAPQPVPQASIGDLERLPARNDQLLAGYREWLQSPPPRAFAIHPQRGAWGSAWGNAQPLTKALENCSLHAGAGCRLYAVDDAVVWKDE